ncbi:cysteine-rich receptor-like protein kinase 42-like, partial [Trifolium medium]|nr:cysteine-rich receptor-like protein kinase 42-like [Trifolium medium]
MQNFKILWGIIIFIIPWFLSRVACYNRGIDEAGLTCDSYQYPADDDSDNKLMQNWMVVMDAVSFQVKEHGWGAQTLVVDKWGCQRCLREAAKRVQECVPSTEGKSLFTGCFM